MQKVKEEVVIHTQPFKQSIAPTLPEYTCLHCKKSWIPRINTPKACPHCHSRRWRLTQNVNPNDLHYQRPVKRSK
jgi:Zn finger protein HypA/HybF involved in hydrogenase expression